MAEEEVDSRLDSSVSWPDPLILDSVCEFWSMRTSFKYVEKQPFSLKGVVQIELPCKTQIFRLHLTSKKVLQITEHPGVVHLSIN